MEEGERKNKKVKDLQRKKRRRKRKIKRMIKKKEKLKMCTKQEERGMKK